MWRYSMALEHTPYESRPGRDSQCVNLSKLKVQIFRKAQIPQQLLRYEFCHNIIGVKLTPASPPTVRTRILAVAMSP